jgi:hypothetical protein
MPSDALDAPHVGLAVLAVALIGCNEFIVADVVVFAQCVPLCQGVRTRLKVKIG